LGHAKSKKFVLSAMGLNGKLQLKACGMWENALVKIFVKQKISPTKILEAKKV
jgi:hypothetical protein